MKNSIDDVTKLWGKRLTWTEEIIDFINSNYYKTLRNYINLAISTKAYEKAALYMVFIFNFICQCMWDKQCFKIKNESKSNAQML